VQVRFMLSASSPAWPMLDAYNPNPHSVSFIPTSKDRRCSRLHINRLDCGQQDRCKQLKLVSPSYFMYALLNIVSYELEEQTLIYNIRSQTVPSITSIVNLTSSTKAKRASAQYCRNTTVARFLIAHATHHSRSCIWLVQPAP